MDSAEVQRLVNAAFSPAMSSARLASEILRFLDTRPSVCALEEWRPVEQTTGGGLPSSAGGVAVGGGGGSGPPLPMPCLLDVQVPLLLAVLASPLLQEDEALLIVDKMLHLGVSPHATDSARRSAVWWAVYVGRLQAADLLVARGGAVRVQTYRAALDAVLNTPWSASCSGGSGSGEGLAFAGRGSDSSRGQQAAAAAARDAQRRLEWVLRRLPPGALRRASADLRWGGADRTAGAYVAAKTLDKVELAEQLGQRAEGEEDRREAAAFGAWARGLPAAAAPLLRVCLLHGSPPLPAGFAEERGAAALEAWRATLEPAAAALPLWCRSRHRLWPPNFQAAVRALLLANHRGVPGHGSGLHLDEHMIDGIIAAAATDAAAWAEAWSLLREHDCPL